MSTLVPARYSKGPLFRKSVFTAVICNRVRVKCNSRLSEWRPFGIAEQRISSGNMADFSCYRPCDRRTNRQTEGHRQCVKPPHLRAGLNNSDIYNVSRKTGPLQLIWHNFTNSQRSVIISGTESLFNSPLTAVKSFFFKIGLKPVVWFP